MALRAARTSNRLLAALFGVWMASAGGLGWSAEPSLTRVGDSLLDEAALFFVSFDGIVNNASYQQSGILTWAGYQYAAWYTADRSAVLARRQLPSGPWARLVLPHALTVNDSHNTISLGVSPDDGRLHVAMDTHDSPIFYVQSEAGLVSNPSARSWVASRFGSVQRTLDGVELGTITYPRFLITPEGRLQFSYRTGRSGNGTMELAEYADGRWSKLGKWSSATGIYRAHGAASSTRNLYLHGIAYGPGDRQHATFTWREGNTAILCNPGGLANHDTGYVFSDDRGRTFRNAAGQILATTGTERRVSVESPGQIVDPLDADRALINQESQAIDSAGNPHVIISYVPGRFTSCVTNFVEQRRTSGRTFHLRREPDGTWRKLEIPIPSGAFGRSRLVLDAQDDAHVVMPFGRIVSASQASGWTDWALTFDGEDLRAFGEVLVDDSTVRSDGRISVLYQETSTGTRPSALRVVDFRLN